MKRLLLGVVLLCTLSPKLTLCQSKKVDSNASKNKVTPVVEKVANEIPWDAQSGLYKMQHQLDAVTVEEQQQLAKLAYYQGQCPSYKNLVELNNSIPGVLENKQKLQTALTSEKVRILKTMNLDPEKFDIDLSTMSTVPLPKTKQEEKK